MGDGTGIEWTDATWNPTVGCTKVSPGCDHCYAETFVNRFAGSKGFPLPFDELLLRGERFLNLPLTWREPRRVFVNSLSDLFHDDIPDADSEARSHAELPEHSCYWKRCSELRQDGLIVDTGQTRPDPRSGEQRIVCTITPAGQQELARLNERNAR